MSLNPFLEQSTFNPDSSSPFYIFSGHLRPQIIEPILSYPNIQVALLDPKIRILRTVGSIQRQKNRLLLANQINDLALSRYYQFLDSQHSSLYFEMCSKVIDLGVVSTRGFLDYLDRSEVPSLILLHTLSIFNSFSRLPSYLVYPHDPHGLCDLAFYFVARFLRIPVYSFRSVLETKFSFVFKNIFSNFSSGYALASPDVFVKALNPNPNFADDWLNGVTKATTQGGWYDVDKFSPKLSINSPLPPSPISIANTQHNSFSNPFKLSIVKLRIRRLLSMLYRTSLRLASFSTFHHFALQKLNHSFYGYQSFVISGKNDIPSPFVYVPLHMQPENTTSTFGGSFANQIELLRKIHNLVGNDVAIVVKDHFCNSSSFGTYSRPSSYQQYLEALIPNLQFAPSSLLSKNLILESLCTFTVNGTATLEACLLGKPACFAGISHFIDLPQISHIYDFSTSEEFFSWIARLKDLNSNISQIRDFFKSRYPFLHNCAIYGATENFSNVSSSLASIHADSNA